MERSEAKKSSPRNKTFYEKANKWRAFKVNEDQSGMIKAADYHDTWFRTKVAAFNVYYICRAGRADWPCRTVTLSKWWKMKHADPWRPSRDGTAQTATRATNRSGGG